eukprot:1209824-Pleurochrysis_carterae.AAC.1
MENEGRMGHGERRKNGVWRTKEAWDMENEGSMGYGERRKHGIWRTKEAWDMENEGSMGHGERRKNGAWRTKEEGVRMDGMQELGVFDWFSLHAAGKGRRSGRRRRIESGAVGTRGEGSGTG